MATTTVSAQLIQYKGTDDQVIVNVKTIASAVGLTHSTASKFSSDITDIQALADALGSLAFSNGIATVTQSAAGLMSADDKKKLDGIADSANKYTHPSYTARNAGLYKITVDATGHVSAVTAVAKSDITGLGIPAQDTTYSVFGAASSTAAGTSGLVPAPGSGKQGQYLRGDGTWATPTNTTYSEATTSTAGLMSASDKSKLDGVEANANNYSHPNSGVTAGTYRSVTVNAQGHVTAGTNPTTLAGYGITDAAAKSHTHVSGDITSLDASKLTGTIDIARIPKAAIEVLVPVANQAARFALTTDDVQKGDTVQEQDTGLMYYVVDETNLGNANGYKEYTAKSASSVPWSGVTGKPSSYTPSAHTQAISTITGLQDALDAKAADQVMTGSTTSAAGAKGLVPAPASGAATRYLRCDGTWVTPPNTTYSVATTSANGLMSSTDKSKLDGIAANANNYSHPTYTSKTSGLYKITVDGTGHVSATTAVAKSDITGLGIPAQDTTYSVFGAASASADGTSGLVPAPASGKQGQYLRGDGTWATPTNTTYSVFKAATASAAGGTGLVPAPAAGAQGLYLRGDGTWATPTNTTYGNATTSTAGLMSASDKSKLDGIAANANNYTHPTTSGNKHVPSGGSAGQILGYSADGTAAWQDMFYIGSSTPSAACMWLKTA